MKDINVFNFTDKELAEYLEYGHRSIVDMKNQYPQRYGLLRLGYAMKKQGIDENVVNLMMQMKGMLCGNNDSASLNMHPIVKNVQDMESYRESIEEQILQGKTLGSISKNLGLSPRLIREGVEKWGGKASEIVALRSTEGKLHNLRTIYILRDRYLDQVQETREWAGADLVITSSDSQTYSKGDTVIKTKYAKELSWLFEKLRDIFAPYLDGFNKFEFYGRLADAANEYLENNQEVNEKDLLIYVHTEARHLFKELKEKNKINQGER